MLISKVVASTRREDHPKGRRLTTVSFSDIFFGQVIDFKRLTRTNCCPSDWCENWAIRKKLRSRQQQKKTSNNWKGRKVQTKKKKINTKKKHTHTQLYHDCVCANETDCVSRAGLWTCQPPCGYCAHSSRRGLVSSIGFFFSFSAPSVPIHFPLDSFYFLFSPHRRRADTFLVVKYTNDQTQRFSIKTPDGILEKEKEAFPSFPFLRYCTYIGWIPSCAGLNGDD